jgi:hypothetical protein
MQRRSQVRPAHLVDLVYRPFAAERSDVAPDSMAGCPRATDLDDLITCGTRQP